MPYYGRECCVPGCETISFRKKSGISTHSLPKAGMNTVLVYDENNVGIRKDVRQVWIDRLFPGRQDLSNTGGTWFVACSKHFQPSDYFHSKYNLGKICKRSCLKSTAVPTQNLPDPAKVRYKTLTMPSKNTTQPTTRTYTFYKNKRWSSQSRKNKALGNIQPLAHCSKSDSVCESIKQEPMEEDINNDLAPIDFVNVEQIKVEEVEFTDTLLIPCSQTSTNPAYETMHLTPLREHTSKQPAGLTNGEMSCWPVLQHPTQVCNLDPLSEDKTLHALDPMSQVETSWKDQEIEFLPVSLVGETLDEYEEEIQPGLLERCRVCARVDVHAVEIFSSEGQQRHLVEKIKNILPITVNKDDRLPLRVCASCEAALEASQQLWELSLRANQALSDLLEQQEQQQEQQLQECGSPAEPISMGRVEETSDTSPAGTSKYLPMPPAPAHLQCQMCSVGCYTAKSLKDHYYNVHFSYMCLHCCDWFDSPLDRSKHADEVHKVKCPFCDSLEFKEYIRSHIHTEHPELKPVFLNSSKSRIEEECICKICKTRVNNVSAAKFHYFWEHQQYACDVCLELFSSSELQLQHSEEVHMIPCWYCKQKFYTPRRLKRHVNKYHREQSSEILQPVKSKSDIFECRSCKKGVSTKLFLKRHNFWSHGNISCDFCLLEFRTPALEEQHFREAHSSVCDLCNEEVSGDFSEHLQANHPHEQPFFCESCGQAFCSREQLAEHRKEHEVKRAFLCDSCGKSYRLKPNLILHKKLVHMSKEDTFKLQCEYCSKMFRFQSQLKCHLLLHTRNKQFKCLDCSKSFLTANSLKSHMKNHSKDQKQKCEFCEAQFSCKKNLRVHMKALHCSQEVYKCTLCDKSFESQKDVEFHMSFHEVEQVAQLEQPFVRVPTMQCEICNNRFSSKQILITHMERHLRVKKKL